MKQNILIDEAVFHHVSNHWRICPSVFTVYSKSTVLKYNNTKALVKPKRCTISM